MSPVSETRTGRRLRDCADAWEAADPAARGAARLAGTALLAIPWIAASRVADAVATPSAPMAWLACHAAALGLAGLASARMARAMGREAGTLGLAAIVATHATSLGLGLGHAGDPLTWLGIGMRGGATGAVLACLAIASARVATIAAARIGDGDRVTGCG